MTGIPSQDSRWIEFLFFKYVSMQTGSCSVHGIGYLGNEPSILLTFLVRLAAAADRFSKWESLTTIHLWCVHIVHNDLYFRIRYFMILHWNSYYKCVWYYRIMHFICIARTIYLRQYGRRSILTQRKKVFCYSFAFKRKVKRKRNRLNLVG